MLLSVTIILFIIGLFIIIKGGDIFINAAVHLANTTGIPKVLIGATIVSIATVLPELLISTLAAARGSPDLSLGNNIGSVIFNTGAIMAISLIVAPQISSRNLRSKGFFMVFSLLVLWALVGDGSLSLSDSAILFLLLAWFIYSSIREAKQDKSLEIKTSSPLIPLSRQILGFIIGAACIVIGAQLLVSNGVRLAQILAVPERIIGLTVVAIGSSLPELVTTITSLRKGESSIGIGNIIGANTLNIILIPPLCSLVSKGNFAPGMENFSIFPHPIPTTIYIDIPLALLLLLIMVVPSSITNKLQRWQGTAMLLLFIIYYILIITL